MPPVCEMCNHEVTQPDAQFCPYCGHPLVPQEDKPSIQQVAEREGRWYTGTDRLPAVIAHEYKRLRALCRENKPYGALLEIKDLYETLLKFEVLLLCAWADYKKNNEFIKSVGCEVTRPNTSLGGWVYLANRMVTFSREHPDCHVPNSILMPVKIIAEKYESYQIVNWRNEHIGHGALGYGEDETFTKEIIHHIERFKTIFMSIGKYLEKQILYKANDEQHIAPDMVRNMGEACYVKVWLTDVKEMFDVDPYIRVLLDQKASRDSFSLYFYDNQNGRITASQMLSYPSGMRRTEKIKRFIDIDKIRRNQTVKSDTNKNLYTASLTLKDTKELNQLWADHMFHSYVVPDAPMAWIHEFIDQYSSGVFYLQMERGMGKSTLCEQLNDLLPGGALIASDVDVRVLHINYAQARDAISFETSLEHLWRQDYDEDRTWINMKSIRYFLMEGKASKWEALCAYLEECQQFTQKERDKKRIMLIIDGLDEITDASIWEYFPSQPFTLPDNVLLLLTSRTTAADDISLLVRERLERICYTQSYTFTRTSTANKAFLTKYIQSIGLSGLSDEDINRLCRAADNRILYLSMLCKLIESGLSIEAVENYDDVLSGYLDHLSMLYGEKEALKLLELISIIGCYANERPLSIQEIADLSWESGVITIDLISKLTDLAPLLHIWHDSSSAVFDRDIEFENRQFSFANPGLAKSAVAYVKNLEQYVLQLRDHTYQYVRECLDQGRICGEGSLCLSLLRILLTDLHEESYAQILLKPEISLTDLIDYVALLSPYLGFKATGDAIQILQRIDDLMTSEHDIDMIDRVKCLYHLTWHQYKNLQLDVAGENAKRLLFLIGSNGTEADRASLEEIRANLLLAAIILKDGTTARSIRKQLSSVRALIGKIRKMFTAECIHGLYAQYYFFQAQFNLYEIDMLETGNSVTQRTNLFHQMIHNYSISIRYAEASDLPHDWVARVHYEYGYSIDRWSNNDHGWFMNMIYREANIEYALAKKWLLNGRRDENLLWHREFIHLLDMKLILLDEQNASFMVQEEQESYNQPENMGEHYWHLYRTTPNRMRGINKDDLYLSRAMHAYLEAIAERNLTHAQYEIFGQVLQHANIRMLRGVSHESMLIAIQKYHASEKRHIQSGARHTNALSYRLNAKSLAKKLCRAGHEEAAACLIADMKEISRSATTHRNKREFQVDVRVAVLFAVGLCMGLILQQSVSSVSLEAVCDFIINAVIYGSAIALWGLLMVSFIALMIQRNSPGEKLNRKSLIWPALFSQAAIRVDWMLIASVYSFLHYFFVKTNHRTVLKEINILRDGTLALSQVLAKVLPKYDLALFTEAPLSSWGILLAFVTSVAFIYALYYLGYVYQIMLVIHMRLLRKKQKKSSK